ncbi:cupin domain-containing protein [Hyphobacterium sp.]|uniref:cupin domain-containing protein n=1 Tax=Hyphobacterium sp. TaxID=2004662 RepID=UPI003747E4D2
MTAADIIRELNLSPHPEGGWFREIFRDETGKGARAHSTAIYFLLEAGQVSHWHRVDAVEVWHWYAGAPLRLDISEDGQSIRSQTLSQNLAAGDRPAGIVPRHAWQSAQSLGDWTLVGCTVAPGFEFTGFELAAEGWAPSGGE